MLLWFLQFLIFNNINGEMLKLMENSIVKSQLFKNWLTIDGLSMSNLFSNSINRSYLICQRT